MACAISCVDTDDKQQNSLVCVLGKTFFSQEGGASATTHRSRLEEKVRVVGCDSPASVGFACVAVKTAPVETQRERGH
jgi:hypothetical protein